MSYFLRLVPIVLAFCPLCLALSGARAASPTAPQALALSPVQDNVPYDTPSSSEIDECRLESITEDDVRGWTVFGKNGQLLRRFLDTNQDKKIDQWCYYRNGIEVYRDIDADFNGKANQYRWLGTAGSRWGLDDNEDGKIDRWKMISPEEVTAEVVLAVRQRDAHRFRTVLLSTDELAQLGLGKSQEKDLKERVEAAEQEFLEYAEQQNQITSESSWLHFGATHPGVVPAGTDGSTKDLLIYDNVAAIVDTDGKHDQLTVGTLVQVGQGWRVIDLPKADSAGGFFYTSVSSDAEQRATEAAEGLDEKTQQLLSSLEEIDQELASKTNSRAVAKLHAERAEVLEQLAQEAGSAEQRTSWTRQFADTISAAAQSGEYPEGVQQLQQLLGQLEDEPASKELIGYVKFRYMTAQYGQQLQEPDAEFAKIQKAWLEKLENFVEQYPQIDDAAEAMLQLAIAEEFAGNEKEAIHWYDRIMDEFGSSQLAKKAAGAKRRLESVGKSISLKGETLDGKSVDLQQYRGQVVLIHYWATWCGPCKEDLELIGSLRSKFPSSKFAAIGVNLDTERRSFARFRDSNRLDWPQLYEEGGLDSRLANEMGILTLPTMLLIDKNGQVVRRNIHSSELEQEIEKRVR